MVDLAMVRARVNAGLGRAASVLGAPMTQFRAANALAPLAAGGNLGTVQAAFDESTAFRFIAPAGYGPVVFSVLADATSLAVGDYLTGAGGTFFLVSLEDMKAATALRTNAVVSVARPYGGVLAGANPPGGDALAVETAFLRGWPAAMFAVGRGDHGDVNLPGDVRMGWWQILMPAFAGAAIRSSDIVIDQTGARHVVMSAELGALGWRITAELEAA